MQYFDKNATKFLFWNVRRKDLGEMVAQASRQADADLVLLAECREPVEVLLQLNASSSRLYRHLARLGGRIDIFSRLPDTSLKALGDYDGLSFRHLRPPIGKDILLVAAHLPSKLHMSDIEQTLHCATLSAKIEHFEAELGHQRTVVVGDFNVNPFEAGLVSAQSFHATSSRSIALRGTRVVQGREYAFFYNPMWNHFGDRGPSPPGTYFYSSSSAMNLFWNMFDQVLIRPELLSAFDDESIQILTAVGEHSLLAEDGKPNGVTASDHLPIVFSINLLRC